MENIIKYEINKWVLGTQWKLDLFGFLVSIKSP